MLIAVWGRDGIGKSTLCDALGMLFAKQGITVIIDTDLTQPTLPVRLNGSKFEAERSLGRAVSGIGANDASRYLHQHTNQKSLFYAGLIDMDEYLSYEIGLEADNAAQDFVDQCLELADMVILDLSGQRTDPFVPGALSNADKIITMFTPHVEGLCWFKSVEHLLETMSAQERTVPVFSMVERHSDIYAIEKADGIQFAISLPYVQEFRHIHGTGATPMDGTTPAALRYVRQVRNLGTLLKGDDSQ